jgi:hypothetical protein
MLAPVAPVLQLYEVEVPLAVRVVVPPQTRLVALAETLNVGNAVGLITYNSTPLAPSFAEKKQIGT